MSRRNFAIAMIVAGGIVGIIAVMRASEATRSSIETRPDVTGAEAADESARADVPDAITWVPYDDAFAIASRTNKPVLMMFTAGWCGHCQTYASNVLNRAEVVAASRRFVMVRIDIDQRRDLNARYGMDGGYVPRTMFFTSAGVHRPDLRAASRSDSIYFLDTHNPEELLSLMRRAASS